MRKPPTQFPSASCSPSSRDHGFALTLTLILVALTAIVVVAFLTTTSTERTTAAAYGRVERARQMAEAGADAGIARLITEMKYRPYHAMGYRSVNNGMDTEIVPVITGPRTVTPATVPTYNTAPVATDDVYLISGPGANAEGIPGAGTPSGFTATNSVDLNNNRLASEPKGWIGSPTGAATPIPYRALWIDVLADSTKTPQPDPSQANYNPVIGRYAYWIEDEASKLDVSLVGNQDGGGAFKRGDGVDLPSATPSPKLAMNDLDIGALPLVNSAPLGAGDVATNQAILNLRSTMPILDARFLNRAGGQMASDVAETTKFYSTVFSLSNDLAGTGRRRANINALVTNTSAPEIIAANIDDIGYVITGTHLMDGTLVPNSAKASRVFDGAPTTANSLSSFGLRFFASPTPSSDQQNMYIERIAANIRDYIDSDNLATYIDTSDTVIANVKPAVAWTNGSEPRALGKEAVPLLQEIAWYGYQRTMQNDPGGKSRSYNVDIDFYFEFFNPSTKDFVAPRGAFLKVYNRVQWSAGSYPWVKPPDTEFNISGIPFPAGQALVLTTETDPSLDPPGMILDPSKVKRLSGATRNFTGHTDENISGNYGLQMQGRAGSSTKTTDYSTEAVWGTTTGIYDGIGYVSSGGDSTNTWNMDGKASEIQNKTRFVYAYSLRGNDDNSRSGDPRSLSEQLSMTGGLASLGNDQTRFYANTLGTGVFPTSTFGKAQISYVDPTKWPDYTPPLSDTNVTAYAVQTDAPMQSIGELGNIYDPIRTVANTESAGVTPSILRARGGGRTLKIGQIDDRISGGRFSPTWFNAAWRLVDLFSADTSKDSSGNFPKILPPTRRGKINVNGVLRDGGVAFKAALRSFVFKSAPESDQNLNGKMLSDPEANKLISDLTAYLTTNGPMMERGELSQLSYFNSGTAGGFNNLGKVNDRGREEIFRRCVEMITTRSASFTIYAIGQAVRQDKNGIKTAVGEKRMATTFQLQPKTGTALLETSLKPYDVVDNYSVRKVYVPN